MYNATKRYKNNTLMYNFDIALYDVLVFEVFGVFFHSLLKRFVIPSVILHPSTESHAKSQCVHTSPYEFHPPAQLSRSTWVRDEKAPKWAPNHGRKKWCPASQRLYMDG